jgi:hypothetical protein
MVVIGLRRRVECPDVVHQVVAREDLQRRLVDHPLRHESAVGAVGAHHAGQSGIGVGDFMVHQHREGAVAVVECAETVGNADHGVAVGRLRRLIPRRDQRLDIDVRVGADEIRCLGTRWTFDLAGNDELLFVEIGELGVLNHQLIVSAKIDDDVVLRRMRRVEDGLERREMEIANIDAVARLQIRDAVQAGALANEERIVVGAADQYVLSGSAEQQVAAAAAEEVIVALLSERPRRKGRRLWRTGR